MAMTIHPSALIHPTAELAEDVEIGPGAIVGPRVRIGARTRLRAQAQIISDTVIGSDCDIYPNAIVGGEPQDLKYKGEQTELLIGDGNIIREFVTINRGTALGGGKTVLGNNNLIMAYVHIAHDCQIGNRVVITNGAQLAGHIHVEDFAIISGMVLIHHFVTVGTMSFCAPYSGHRVDVPPYVIADGIPARVRKLNLEGLRRHKVPAESIQALKLAFKAVYRSELPRHEALAKIEASPYASDPYVRNLVAHFRASEAGYQGRALEAFRKDRRMLEEAEEEE